jgi:hypothetical protein
MNIVMNVFVPLMSISLLAAAIFPCIVWLETGVFSYKSPPWAREMGFEESAAYVRKYPVQWRWPDRKPTKARRSQVA